MTFGNLLYYPGRFHSPLRLVGGPGCALSSQPSSSQPSSSQPGSEPTLAQPDPVQPRMHDPLSFYALASGEDPNESPLFVAVVLHEHRETQSKEIQWMARASRALRHEMEVVLYPGCIIKTSANVFSLQVHPRTHGLFDGQDDLSFDADLSHSSVGDADTTPHICFGTLALRSTRTNLRKGAQLIQVRGGSKQETCPGDSTSTADAVTWRDQGWQDVSGMFDGRVRAFKEMVENRLEQLLHV